MEKEAELLSANKAAKAEAKELSARAKAEKEAARLAGIKVPEAPVFADFTETFDKAAYDAEKQAIADAEAKAKADAAQLKIEKREAKEAAKEEKIDAYYTKAVSTQAAKNDKKELKSEEKAALIATYKADKAEAKALSEREKAIAKAEKLIAEAKRPEEIVYPDITETFDEALYNAEKQAVIDAENAAKANAAAQKAEAIQIRNDKLIGKYDDKLAKRAHNKEEGTDLLALAKQDVLDKEAKKTAADKAKQTIEAARLAALKKSEVVYPDPEYVPDEFSGDLYDITLPEPGDVLEGGKVRITSLKEQRRVAKEDQQLKLLVKKDKKSLKRAAYVLETLNLAEKYVDDGSLELADTATVLSDSKLFKQETKDILAVKEYESSLENKEMLDFEQDYGLKLKRNKRRLAKAKKYGKFMLEYGSTYDPEWNGSFDNFGLPEVHPFTEGVKLPTSRRRTPKKERLSFFNKKQLSDLSREQCNNDIKMIEARVEYDYTALEVEVSKVEQEFSGEYRTKKEKRWLRDSREKLKNFKAKVASAVKYEKLDNERYYSVVATDFERVELPAKSDREELIAMREELMRLLDIRDDINSQLLELYTGKENGMKGSTKGRAKAVLKARKRAHVRMRRYFNVLSKHRVTRNEKMRIFDKLDEIVELKGDIARVNYILRKEKPTGKVKRDYIKERKNARRDVRILKKSVERSTIKALKRARRLERQMRVMFAAYTVLGALLLFVLAMVVMGPQILEASKTFIPENLHEYIDLILNEWPL